MITQKYEQKMSQKLTPQQILLMRLLHLPIISLENFIKEELENNPLLEDSVDNSEHSEEYTNDTLDDEYSNLEPYDDFNLEEYMDDDLEERYDEKRPTSENYIGEQISNSGTTLHEYLTEQFNLKEISEKQYLIGIELIGNIDDSGYMRRDMTSLSNDLAFNNGIDADEKEIDDVLNIIKTLDPIGVGARDLQECLLIQLHNIANSNPYKKWGIKIIENNFDTFIKNNHNKLIQKLNISESDLSNTLKLITGLNPKPGSSFSNENTQAQYIIPDFFVFRTNDDTLSFSQNGDFSDLKMSKTYLNILKDITKDEKQSEEQKATVSFIKEKAESARWFIDAVKQRKKTLDITMKEILEYQKTFFLSGDKNELRPMILKDIAERTGFDISTLSRIVSQKYVKTEFGTFKLKDLFSVSHDSDDGKGVSVKSIRNMIQELVDNEDKSNPLSDKDIQDIINTKGFNFSRRTIAKYRELLNIPIKRLRKKI